METLAPEATKLVIIKDGIAADDGQVFGLGLSDQHPIEGIAMRSREETGAGGVGGGDRKRFERFLREHCVEMESKFRALGELSDTELGGDFPGRCRTDQDRIGTSADEFASGGWKRWIISKPPEQRMRVQEKAQRSLPGFEFGLGKRFEELAANDQFPLPTARLALAFLGA